MVAHGIDGTLRTRTRTNITSSGGGVGGHWMGLEKCAHCAVYKKYAWQGESHVHSRVSSTRLCYPMSVVGVMSQHGLTFAKGERWSFPVPKHYKTECPNIIIHNFARPNNKWKKFPHWSIKYCIWRDFMQVPIGLTSFLVLGQVLYCISEDEWWPYHHWDRLVNWALTARKTKETLRICCYRHLTRVFNIGK